MAQAILTRRLFSASYIQSCPSPSAMASGSRSLALQLMATDVRRSLLTRNAVTKPAQAPS